MNRCNRRLIFIAIFRSALLTAAAIGAFFLFSLFTQSLPLRSTQADFVQDYLMAKAILDGRNPYSPLADLGSQFGASGLTMSPSAHPPTFAVLSVPLGLLSYRTAKLAWLVISVGCLGTSLFLLFRLRLVMLLIFLLALVSWKPIHSDLAIGQVMVVLLVVLTGSWALLKSGREVGGGLMIGLALCLKLIAWPLVLYLLIKKRFRAAFASLGAFAVGNLIAASVIGIESVANYYLRVGPLVSSAYRNDPFNFSVWSLGERVFSGTHGIFAATSATPLIDNPALALPFSMFCVVVLITLVVYGSIRPYNFDRHFSLLVCGSIILSPTAWWFYLSLLLIVFKVAWQVGGLWPKVAILFALFAPYVPPLTVHVFGPSMGFAPALLMLAPMFSVLLLGACVSLKPAAQDSGPAPLSLSL